LSDKLQFVAPVIHPFDDKLKEALIKSPGIFFPKPAQRVEA
jgi:hypothetical protein